MSILFRQSALGAVASMKMQVPVFGHPGDKFVVIEVNNRAKAAISGYRRTHAAHRPVRPFRVHPVDDNDAARQKLLHPLEHLADNHFRLQGREYGTVYFRYGVNRLEMTFRFLRHGIERIGYTGKFVIAVNLYPAFEVMPGHLLDTGLQPLQGIENQTDIDQPVS